MGFGNLTVVADTGPFLHLTEIGCIDFFNVFEKIIVPTSVRQEYLKHKESITPDFFNLKNIENEIADLDEIQKFKKKYNLNKLHSGEIECLYFCKKLSINILSTDDLAVRNIVKELDIVPVGSLGIILRVYREGVITKQQAENHLYELYEKSSLFVTKTVVDLVVERLKKY